MDCKYGPPTQAGSSTDENLSSNDMGTNMEFEVTFILKWKRPSYVTSPASLNCHECCMDSEKESIS